MSMQSKHLEKSAIVIKPTKVQTEQLMLWMDDLPG